MMAIDICLHNISITHRQFIFIECVYVATVMYRYCYVKVAYDNFDNKRRYDDGSSHCVILIWHVSSRSGEARLLTNGEPL